MTIKYTLWRFDLFYGHLVDVVAIRYITPVLVYFVMKNLAAPSANKILVYEH
jgi:hypothetical protein